MENRPPTPQYIEVHSSDMPWETRVAFMGDTRLRNILRSELKGEQLPEFQFPSDYPQEYQLLNKMYELDRRTMRDYTRDVPAQKRASLYQRASFYKGLATEMRDKKRYYLFNNLLDVIPVNPFIENRDIPFNPPEIVTKILAIDLATLHLTVSRADRLLVGIKDGVYWKKIAWPKEQGYLLGSSSFYLSAIPYIGEKELITVPERPLGVTELKELRLPTTPPSAEDLLESAYYGQRYIVPTEGAEVRFKQAGDLERMIVVQSGDLFFAKAITSRGETFAAVDINTGAMEYHGSLETCIVAAGVYHDLVTAIELPKNRYKSLTGFKTAGPGPEEENPQFIYIPRIIRTGTKEDRPIYDGPPRPVSPHRVRGHRRAGNLTEKHRLELLAFEQKYNVSILEFLPAGFTFVRPHFVPSDANLEGLPVFIKRRIQSKIQEDLQKPA